MAPDGGTYPDDATRAAVEMWGKGMRVHQIRAALNNQFPHPEGWSLMDVHAAIGQRLRDLEREKARAL